MLGLAGVALLGASWVRPRCEPSPRWLRRWGLVALMSVVLQGVLGGLRVVLLKDAIGVLHATLAQLFFVLTCAIALYTSGWWQALPARRPSAIDYRMGTLFVATTVMILAQLTVGAAMRHQHAGLAIPDFPLAYGKLWPGMDAGSVALYNARRMEIVAVNPITAFQIGLQMAHRFLALVIFGAVAFAAWSARRKLGAGDYLSRLAVAWLGLILTQALLGAATIWSDKAADVATVHVLFGAICLGLGAMMSLIAWRELAYSHGRADSGAVAEQPYLSMLRPQPSAGAGSH